MSADEILALEKAAASAATTFVQTNGNGSGFRITDTVVIGCLFLSLLALAILGFLAWVACAMGRCIWRKLCNLGRKCRQRLSGGWSAVQDPWPSSRAADEVELQEFAADQHLGRKLYWRSKVLDRLSKNRSGPPPAYEGLQPPAFVVTRDGYDRYNSHMV